MMWAAPLAWEREHLHASPAPGIMHAALHHRWLPTSLLVHRRVGGSIWHLVKGVKNSPSGSRLFGGLQVRLLLLGKSCLRQSRGIQSRPPQRIFVRPCLPPMQAIFGWGVMRRLSMEGCPWLLPAGVLSSHTMHGRTCCSAHTPHCHRQSIRREGPKIGGSFAVWGGLFSTFDCSFVALRKKV